MLTQLSTAFALLSLLLLPHCQRPETTLTAGTPVQTSLIEHILRCSTGCTILVKTIAHTHDRLLCKASRVSPVMTWVVMAVMGWAAVLDSWWLDDWISWIYGPAKTCHAKTMQAIPALLRGPPFSPSMMLVMLPVLTRPTSCCLHSPAAPASSVPLCTAYY